MSKIIKSGAFQSDVKTFLKAGNSVFITFPCSMSVKDIISACSAFDEIEYYDGEELKECVQGYTSIECVSRLSGGYRVELKKAHTLENRVVELEKLNKNIMEENRALSEQVTELQLAIVELYEGGLEE